MKAELLIKQNEALFMFDAAPVAPRKRNFQLQFGLRNDKMAAVVKVATAGMDCDVTLFDLVVGLVNQGISFGVDYAQLESIIEGKRFNQEVVVAKGRAPEDGAAAVLIPQVKLEEFTTPEEIKRSPGMQVKAGEPVELDQCIMIKQPATPGVNGSNVLGEELAAKPGADVAFDHGDNVSVSDDGLKLVASIPGMAGLSNGKPAVREKDYGEWKFDVKLRKENMEAALVIVPGLVERPPIDDDFVVGLLKSKNVVFGVLKDIARGIPPKITLTTVIKAAEGREPSPGRDAVVTERFRSGDDKDRHFFFVKKGQLIVEKTPAKPGVAGMDVLGRAIQPGEGLDKQIVAGQNTMLSDNGCKLFATMDGYVSRVKEAYCVVECKEYGAEGAPLPQMINYDGMVRIHGNVPKNHVVIAGHHIAVGGDVHSAEIVAGGILKIDGDIDECSNTKIQAGQDMLLASARRTRLRAGGNVYFSGKAEDCEVIASGGIYHTEDAAFEIAGGRLVAGRNIEADEIGGAGDAPAVLEAGLPFQLRVRYENAVREAADTSKKRTVAAQELARLLKLAAAKQISADDLQKLRKLDLLHKMLKENVEQHKEYVAKYLPLVVKLSKDACVTARKTAHPDTILKIGVHSLKVGERIDGAIFKINPDNSSIDTQKLKTTRKNNVTIMFTDIVGYSTYTSRYGDRASNEMLRKHNELLFPVVPEFGGRIIKTIGDSIMAVFERPADAVNAGIRMQKILKKHNADVPREHRIKIRIGMNTGIGIIEDNDVFGDVVNMAARVEALTGGDEIRISVSTYEALEGKIEAEFNSLGLKQLKGKEELVEVFDVVWDDE